MGIYTQTEYDNGVITGFADEKIKAWHQAGIDINQLKALGRAFDGPVPADVAERLIGWEPVVVTPKVILDLKDDGNYATYNLPDRLSKFIVNPNTGNVVNVVGDGYVSDLHITLKNAIQAAMDAEADIASVVCLGDGAHLGMSFRARDSITLGGNFGGAQPYVGLGSSLTGALATTAHTGTTLIVCDNTAQAAEHGATKLVRVKRTRFSAAKITASTIREGLEIAFAETQDLCDELERLANIPLNTDGLMTVLTTWRPIPEEAGRSQTMAKQNHLDLLGELSGARNPFGSTVAGLVQAHNTWAHWQQTSRGFGDSPTARLDRMAIRSATGKVRTDDEEFFAIVAEAFPEAALAVAS